MNAIDDLKAVLCDIEGKVCCNGSDGDRDIIQKALAELATLLAQSDEWRKDAERMNELQRRFLALDSNYGEHKETVIIIRWDTDLRVSISLRKTVDAAIEGDATP